MSAAVGAVPLVDSDPLQLPDPVHVVAFVELQVKVDVPPLETLVGVAVRVTVGAGCVTVTAADAVPDPPAPVQVRVKVELEVSALLAALPLVDSDPLQAPEAVHDVAFVELQVSVEVPFAATVVGLADN
ncbi:MAG: hypothetical protein JO042_03610 [Sinobacteraceae bacterium]|nr:hypothetical protein [Nevskiaceae bacterium]